MTFCLKIPTRIISLNSKSELRRTRERHFRKNHYQMNLIAIVVKICNGFEIIDINCIPMMR